MMQTCKPKLPRPWKTKICDEDYTDIDLSDHVKKSCSDSELCVPLHYSEIGCSNMGSLRNTTVSALRSNFSHSQV